MFSSASLALLICNFYCSKEYTFLKSEIDIYIYIGTYITLSRFERFERIKYLDFKSFLLRKVAYANIFDRVYVFYQNFGNS